MVEKLAFFSNIKIKPAKGLYRSYPLKNDYKKPVSPNKVVFYNSKLT